MAVPLVHSHHNAGSDDTCHLSLDCFTTHLNKHVILQIFNDGHFSGQRFYQNWNNHSRKDSSKQITIRTEIVSASEVTECLIPPSASWLPITETHQTFVKLQCWTEHSQYGWKQQRHAHEVGCCFNVREYAFYFCYTKQNGCVYVHWWWLFFLYRLIWENCLKCEMVSSKGGYVLADSTHFWYTVR